MPCAFCGLTGLRPTSSLVSRTGRHGPLLEHRQDRPIARSAEDCGHILNAIAGGDIDDPGSAGRSFHFLPNLGPPLTGMTAGYAAADFESVAGPALRPALREALDVFHDIGLQLREAELPDYPYESMAETIIGAEGATVFADLIESGAVNNSPISARLPVSRPPSKSQPATTCRPCGSAACCREASLSYSLTLTC